MMKVDVENAFKNLSQVAIFRELCDVGGFWRTFFPLPSCFVVLILKKTTNMGNMWRRSPLLNHT
jgi:hypothetical protein